MVDVTIHTFLVPYCKDSVTRCDCVLDHFSGTSGLRRQKPHSGFKVVLSPLTFQMTRSVNGAGCQ